MAKKKVTKKSINTKREAKASKEKVVRIPKISWVVKPDGMSLEQWQRALRLQIAREETMSVAVVDERNVPGEYEVWNPLSRQTYKVVYRGEKSQWNYCSCMDFKTSRLGTCKHIEKVKLWISEERRQRVHEELPAYTSVYLSYTGNGNSLGCNGSTDDGREVKIRVGYDHREEFMQLAFLRPSVATSSVTSLTIQTVSFLSGLAQTLQSPEATEQLVNSLVETDDETGESHLRIPVPDKQTVNTLLNLVGKLFAK